MSEWSVLGGWWSTTKYNWRKRRERRRRRLLYEDEISQLRRELLVLHLHQELAEYVLIDKQEKINRLLLAIESLTPTTRRATGLCEKDFRREKIITTIAKIAHDYSADFEDRQSRYEQTGRLNRQECALTEAPPKQDDTPPDPPFPR